MLPATTKLARKNVVHLFADPRFETRLSVEDEILPPTNLNELYAGRAVQFWLSLPGTVKPQRHKEKDLIKKAQKEFIKIFEDSHPRVKRLTIEEIYTSMKNFNLATTDPNYQPVMPESKKKLRGNHNLLRFIYNPRTSKSMLTIFLTEPPTIEKDPNPKLTECLMSQFGKEKWGGGKIDIPLGSSVFFVRTTKQIVQYLEKNKKRFQFNMRQQLNDPKELARTFIVAISRSSNWNEFQPHWLCNTFSMTKFDLWMKSQGYFRFN